MRRAMRMALARNWRSCQWGCRRWRGKGGQEACGAEHATGCGARVGGGADVSGGNGDRWDDMGSAKPLAQDAAGEPCAATGTRARVAARAGCRGQTELAGCHKLTIEWCGKLKALPRQIGKLGHSGSSAFRG